MLKNINKVAFFILVIYPILLIILGINYYKQYSLSWFEICLFIGGYYIANISVGIGLHRLWAHDSFKTNKYVEFILALLSAGTLQGPVLSWVSNHFDHHTYTDTEKDPHSSMKFDNKIKSFFWSHMGWMLVGEGSYRSINRVTMVKLGRNKILRWQLKYYWYISIIMNTFVPAFIGYIYSKTLLGAYAGFIFIGLGRSLQQQITFFVNSLCHFVGTKRYIQGTSGDIWWLALLLLGENWHNFHHAFPSDYRNGAKWYQLDIHKWIIYIMSKLNLAYDLKRTASLRVEAKVMQTMEQFIKLRQQELLTLQDKVNQLTRDVQDKLYELEASSIKIKEKIYKSFIQAQTNILSVAQQLHHTVKNFDNPSERIIQTITKKVFYLEQSLLNLYSEFEMLNSLKNNS